MTNAADSYPKRVERIAQSYRAWGYEVLAEPGKRDLPAALGSYRPDLLARNGDVTVFIEVADDEPAPGHYQEVAERVRSIPGWRYDLFLPDRREPATVGDGFPPLLREEIHSRYREAEALRAAGHADAALLLAWAATEALLRLLAEREDATLPRQETPFLLKHLVTLGVISRDQFVLLREAAARRNAVAHGFAVGESGRLAERLIELGDELAAEAIQ
ncbi:MAG TPA: hypothetical protein VFX98_03095 [Longimicrobiaceae bacterium]|nr:hypothetical protein [Longimicrobiaceae bacterium]